MQSQTDSLDVLILDAAAAADAGPPGFFVADSPALDCAQPTPCSQLDSLDVLILEAAAAADATRADFFDGAGSAFVTPRSSVCSNSSNLQGSAEPSEHSVSVCELECSDLPLGIHHPRCVLSHLGSVNRSQSPQPVAVPQSPRTLALLAALSNAINSAPLGPAITPRAGGEFFPSNVLGDGNAAHPSALPGRETSDSDPSWDPAWDLVSFELPENCSWRRVGVPRLYGNSSCCLSFSFSLDFR